MNRRTAALGVVAAIWLSLLAGCASDNGPATTVTIPPATAPAVPTSSPSAPRPPSPAAVTFRRLQVALKAEPGIRVRNRARGDRGSSTSDVSANLVTGQFRAVVDFGDGHGTLEMLRLSDLTWTRAPVPVWLALGYTRASARRARGKWVVAQADAIKAFVATLDPTLLVTGIEQLSPSAAISRRVVTAGPSRGTVALRVRSGGGIRTLFVTPGVRPLLTRVTSGSGASAVDLRIVGYPAHIAVAVPNAADVLEQP